MRVVKNEPLPTKIELSEHEKISLMEIIRHYEPIWNPGRAGYKDYHVKRTCWTGVTEEMRLQFCKNYQLTELQRIYRNTRDTYVKKHRELQNLRSKTSGVSPEDFQKVTSWPYFKVVASFLDTVLDAAPRYCPTAEGNNAIQDEPLFENGTPTRENEVFMDNFEPEGEYAPGTSDSEPSISRIESSAPRTARTQRAERNHERNAKKRKTPDDDFKEVLPTCSSSDTYDSLGAYLAARLRELNDLDPLLCEEWILQVERLQSGLTKEILEFKKKNLRR